MVITRRQYGTVRLGLKVFTDVHRALHTNNYEVKSMSL